MTGWPRISIVVPSLDQGEFLGAALESVCAQAYPDLELIVVDGDSADGSREIIHRYEARLTWWVSEPDAGQSDAIAKGMRHATGALVNWLNADDLLLPGALVHVAEAYRRADTDEVVLVGGAASVDACGHELARFLPHRTRTPVLPSAPPLENGIQASTFLSRSAWDRVGGVDVGLDFAMDIDLYLRCGGLGIPFVAVDEVIAAYRHHPRTKSRSRWRESVAEKREVLHRHLALLPPSQRQIHEPGVRSYVSSLYLRAITPATPVRQRLERLARALIANPALLTRRHKLGRVVAALRASDQGSPGAPTAPTASR